MGRTHSLSGAAVFLAVSPALGGPWWQAGAGTVVAAYAALLPDLDHPGSTASRTLGPLHGLARLVARVTGGHRGGTHSLAAGAVLGLLVGWWAPWVGAATAVGYLAHVAGDCLTDGGCALLWPLTRRRFRAPLTVRTGGLVERIVVAPALVLLVGWLAWPTVEHAAIDLTHLLPI